MNAQRRLASPRYSVVSPQSQTFPSISSFELIRCMCLFFLCFSQHNRNSLARGGKTCAKSFTYHVDSKPGKRADSFFVPFSRHLGILLFLMSSFVFGVSLDVAAH
jgi:hypothetical protein